jgi:hypothetical protein
MNTIKKSIAVLAAVGSLCCFGAANAANPVHLVVVDHTDGSTSVHHNGVGSVGSVGSVRSVRTTVPVKEVVVYRNNGRQCFHGVDRNPINNRSRGSVICR